MSSKELTSRPDVPVSYLRYAIGNQGTYHQIHDNGWERARTASFNDASMAMVLATCDPDSFHRHEALNRLMTSPFENFTQPDRRWPEENLHRLPGSEENQHIIAESLRSWANGYADTEERRDLGEVLADSEFASEAEIGRSLLPASTPARVEKRERKGWLRRS